MNLKFFLCMNIIKNYVIENKEGNMINQLFSKNPDREIMLEILSAFGYNNLNNTDQPFNKIDLEKRKTIDKIITKIENPDEIIIDGSFKRARTGLLISK